MQSFSINNERLKQIITEGKSRIIDVRTPEEYNTSHIKEAENIPLDSLIMELEDLDLDKNQKTVLICHSGGRSARAYYHLTNRGFKDVSDLEDGMMGWDGETV